MKLAAIVVAMIVLGGAAGCTGRATRIGVGVGVGVAAASCIPLLVAGDGTMGPPLLAATGGVIGGTLVVGSLIGYALGVATKSDASSPTGRPRMLRRR